MGLKKFFKKVGGWVKDKFHAAKTGVQKFAKVVKDKVIPVVQKGVNFIDKTPISNIINSFTGGAFDKAKNLINLLPNGKVKDKMQEYEQKAEDMRNKVTNEVDKRQNQAREIIDKGRDIINRGQQALNIIKGPMQAVTAPAPKPNM